MPESQFIPDMAHSHFLLSWISISNIVNSIQITLRHKVVG